MKAVPVTCGYLPLVDSAPLIIAKELRFAAEVGLDLTLAQQPSWSALRDRLAFGALDFAHMLSPMPIAMSLGLGAAPSKIDALMVLAVNGTVIGISDALAQAMQAGGWRNTFDAPKSTADAVLNIADKPLRIGVPFPFSMHKLLVEYWLSKDPAFAAGNVEIITIPPPQMAGAVADNRIDMFCVGEPWGSVAVQKSGAHLILPSSAIWQSAPEKVLGARHDWIIQNRETTDRMIRATYLAAQWLEQPQNIPLAIEILASSDHLDLPDHAIEPALTGYIAANADCDPIHVPNFITFHKNAANFPWESQAQWIAARLNMPNNQRIFRSDIFRDAITPLGANIAKASQKPEGAMTRPTTIEGTKGPLILGPDTFFDGAIFDFGAGKMLKS
ncbi:CmpA/NrtA family ABC transporter substrate-binding protein [Celeribacter marinus]|uniref:Nitrate ABC transporter, nitrate-binding protein n=1 Tax=Celeribacter marinus TaxID=1397108 RepID=A0A0P0A723_9RHOB|nr:CmpA/NrtA family ABC transporter substrate-binding protein [Celeribacter marinus]ALI54121.1 nitrate ABC transporter, nitrate-binding protein [Celeribacter marinus]SFL02196.1 NitT/TauT family transport system ATP-binding protein [Celeribacter marinus]